MNILIVERNLNHIREPYSDDPRSYEYQDITRHNATELQRTAKSYYSICVHNSDFRRLQKQT